MTIPDQNHHSIAGNGLLNALFTVGLLFFANGCATTGVDTPDFSEQPPLLPITEYSAPSPDPRVGLAPGLFDAEEAFWNMTMIAQKTPPEDYLGSFNSDLAFIDNYAIQGNYNGFMIWDISNPADPELVTDYLCPASQSDVSVYNNLLFVSGEGLEGRLDCGTEGVQEAASQDRLRGIRIFDISNVEEPEYIANVQTCRGSHTHSVLADPNDTDNVYIYVSGSAPVRPESELPGCIGAMPEEDPETALFRIEVIQVPLANPQDAAIVSSPRIFENLEAPPRHSGLTPADLEAIREAEEEGAFIAEWGGRPRILSDNMVQIFLEAVVDARGGDGEATAADSLTLRENLQPMIEEMLGPEQERRGPNQCHDITVYPEAGLAAGACEGYGLLLDITDPVNPVRIDAVADSNFAYWHSATFNNDGTAVLFTDEWGGGVQPKCRETDPMEWGANAIFTIEDNNMVFQSYYKLPAPQTAQENCVAHNGSLIPVPGRDIKVQAWYQGGISIFDWTDPANPIEIAYHDRGPVASDRLQAAGSWSVYWYNGAIVSSEIARGLDIFILDPSEYLTENEIEAANTVRYEQLNAQGQPKYDWEPSFALARAYLDQIERAGGMNREAIISARESLSVAENGSANDRSRILTDLADTLEGVSVSNNQARKVETLTGTIRQLGS